ncbi:MAG: phosphatase PAP2 family protein [Paludibacteraceae bacterium]|nr:phosphatase PAP2 family protein [Paludibacteraceae bacterium]
MNLLRRTSVIVFLTASLCLLVMLGVAICFVPKAELHIMLCGGHRPFLDTLFRYYTVVGEWVPYVVGILLLFYRAGWACFTLISVSLAGLIGQLIKYIVNAPRPIVWFAEHYPEVELPLVEGVKMNMHCSFPSGHTISFFAMFLALTFAISDKPCRFSAVLAFFFFLLASLGGYSRIYLSQHFALDVFAGIFIGILTTILLYKFSRRWQSTLFWRWHIPSKF